MTFHADEEPRPTYAEVKDPKGEALCFLNIPEGGGMEDWLKWDAMVDDVAKALPAEYAEFSIGTGRVRAEILDNDWEAHPNGDIFRVRAGRSGLPQSLDPDDLSRRAAEATARFIERARATGGSQERLPGLAVTGGGNLSDVVRQSDE